MKARLLAAAALVLAAGCAPAERRAEAPAAGPAPAVAVALRNPGFEMPARPAERCAPHWGCTMHADPESFRFRLDTAAAAGERSLCIERVKPEPWALATQAIDDASLRGRRLRFSLALRAAALEGRGAGPWVQVHGVPLAGSHHEKLVARTDGWQRLSVEFVVPAAATLIEVGAILEGAGRACIDEARLEIVE